jgi:cation diffusion facilitator CzcD-associated flavoprotein CzcO
VILERGARAGHTWHNLYDSLTLHTGKHLSALPGLRFPSATPLFPSRRDFLGYLDRYVDRFRLSLQTGVDVVRATPERDGWVLRTASGGEVRARAVVVATGIVSNPYLADVPGRDRFRGTIIHSVQYRRPEPYQSRRVLVVGAGNSAGEIAAELADAGAIVTLGVRSGARVVPRELFGIPVQYFAVALNRLPRAWHRSVAEGIARASELIRGPAVLPRPRDARCSDVPLIGFHLVNAVRAGKIQLRGAVSEITFDGARFADGRDDEFDCIILATGFRAAVGMLQDQIRRDECGFANRCDRVASADQRRLYFVGHNYDTRGALRNIAQDARLVGKAIASTRVARASPLET